MLSNEQQEGSCLLTSQVSVLHSNAASPAVAPPTPAWTAVKTGPALRDPDSGVPGVVAECLHLSPAAAGAGPQPLLCMATLIVTTAPLSGTVLLSSSPCVYTTDPAI